MPLDTTMRTTSDKAVKDNAAVEQRSAGPDGPDATEIGDTFKRQP